LKKYKPNQKLKKLNKSDVKSLANVDEVKDVTHAQRIDPIDKSVAQELADALDHQ
jgi:hypothetical protein